MSSRSLQSCSRVWALSGGESVRLVVEPHCVLRAPLCFWYTGAAGVFTVQAIGVGFRSVSPPCLVAFDAARLSVSTATGTERLHFEPLRSVAEVSPFLPLHILGVVQRAGLVSFTVSEFDREFWDATRPHRGGGAAA